jgi:ABC-type antimicrobial peptide transport system ATPase subunit
MVETLLEVRNLSKTFRYRTGLFHRQNVEAVKPLSFTLREKQTLAISSREISVCSATASTRCRSIPAPAPLP